MAPHVVLERRDVEIADENRALAVLRAQLFHRAQFIEEGELVGELFVDRRIGLVAAGGHVEIMQGDRIA